MLMIIAITFTLGKIDITDVLLKKHYVYSLELVYFNAIQVVIFLSISALIVNFEDSDSLIS